MVYHNFPYQIAIVFLLKSVNTEKTHQEVKRRKEQRAADREKARRMEMEGV